MFRLESKCGWIISGPEIRELAEIKYPPFVDLEFGERFKALNLSNLDVDWEPFYNYVFIKAEDMMLEVRGYFLK